MAFGLGFLILNLDNLTKRLIELKNAYLAKYKHLFNGIQESIVVVKNEEIHFCNSNAVALLTKGQGGPLQME